MKSRIYILSIIISIIFTCSPVYAEELEPIENIETLEDISIDANDSETASDIIPDISDNNVNISSDVDDTDNIFISNDETINNDYLNGDANTDFDNSSNDSQITELENKSDQIIEQMNTTLSDASDIYKALYLHDWLSTHVTYGDGASPTGGALYAYNAIVNGRGVCGDYASAYWYLLHKVGINSYIVDYSDHVWNIIEINNKWYYVDVTWDTHDAYDNVDRSQFLMSKEKCHIYHNKSEIWHCRDNNGDDINLYQNDPTSTDYDNYDWSSIKYNFDDTIFNTSYPQSTTEFTLNDGYTVVASYNNVTLFDNPHNGVVKRLDSITLSSSESATRYIYSISSSGTKVTYKTHLKSDPNNASAEQSHTIDWSQYFQGSCGANATWQYLDGVLSIN